MDQLEARLNLIRLQATLEELHHAQASVVQNAKMMALGRLVGGIAHEINNPIGFIGSNLSHVRDNTADLLEIVELYGKALPEPPAFLADRLQDLEIDYLTEDLPDIIESMESGVDRVVEIVQSLRTFARTQEAEIKHIDLNANLASVLVLLESRLTETDNRALIQIVSNYGKLPRLLCRPALLNQVLLNVLENAIEAIDVSMAADANHPGQIEIATTTDGDCIVIEIADNGVGIPPEHIERIFEPFFYDQASRSRPRPRSDGLLRDRHRTARRDDRTSRSSRRRYSLPDRAARDWLRTRLTGDRAGFREMEGWNWKNLLR